MASGYMFSHYWPGDGEEGEAPEAEDTYPQRQSAVHLLYAGLALLPLPENWWPKLKLLWLVAKLIFSPDFARAQQAVYEVSQTPGFNANDRKAWGQVGSYISTRPGVGENVHRKIVATMKMGLAKSGTREMQDTLLQLAYVAHKRKLFKKKKAQ